MFKSHSTLLHPNHFPYRGNRWVLYLGGLGLVLIVALSVLAALLYLRQQTEQRLIRDSQAMVRSLEFMFEGQIDTVNVTLLALSSEISHLVYVNRTGAQEVDRYLDLIRKGLPDTDVIRATNEQGEMLYGQDVPYRPMSIADRDYFQQLRDQPDLGMLMVPPIIGRLDQLPRWPFARRIDTPDGSFGGIVLASILIDDITGLFERVKGGTNGFIALRGKDLGLIARYTGGEQRIPLGDRRVSPRFLEALKMNPREGTYRFGSEGSVDRESRIYSYRVNPKYGFVVIDGINVDAAFADWRSQASIASAAVVAFALGVLLLLRFVNNSWTREEREIALRNESELKLAESEERNRLAVNYNQSVTLQIDPADGRILDANEAACAFYGWSKPELCAKFITDLNTLDPGKVAEEFHAAAKEERNYFVFPHRLKSGETKTVEVYSTPITVQGKTTLVSNIHDITARLATEKALVLESSSKEALLEIATDGIHLMDAHGQLIQCSRSFATMLGYTENELLALNVRDWDAIFSLDQFTQFLDNLNALPRTFETVHRRKDGTLIDVEISAKGVEIDGKNCVYASARDITARTAAAEQLRKLSLAVEQSRNVVMITDLKANIEYVNEAFVQTTGYRRDEVIGRNPRMLQSGKTPLTTYQSMWKALTQGQGWKGELSNKRKDGHEYTELTTISLLRNDAGTITHYVALKEDITETKAAEAHIHHLAYYDQLTDLPNRQFLTDRVRQALIMHGRSKQYGALLLIDLDHFKLLNDTLSHNVGDKVLKLVAARLLGCAGEGNTVARVGGDEFVVMLEGLSDKVSEAAAMSELVGRKIIESFQPVFEVGSYSLRSSPSIGIALFSGDRHDTVENVIKQVDLAMYDAKAAGRNTLRFYESRMQVAASARASIEADLRTALVQGWFALYYQIQVSSTGQVVGSEALLRMQHPQRGVIAPGEFISVAEESGLIVPIGNWVLETACVQLAQWASAPETRDLSLAINVSAQQFRDAKFVEHVSFILDQTGATPNLLKLEPTESLLFENVEETIQKMSALRAIGVRFSLDDFGTGYSSLSYLKRLPLDQIKIDQSFVRDIPQDANACSIATAIISLAKGLELDVIAEGVETEAQRQFLSDHGCALYQGYLFSRPIPADQFGVLVKKLSENQHT